MDSLLKRIDRLSERSGQITGYIIYPGIFILTWEVVARYFFNSPTIWAHGVSQRLFAAYYILGGAYVLRHKAHINMDIVYSRRSPRTKAILDVIGAVPFFLLCFVLLWFGSGFAWESLRQLEPDATIFRAPVYPVKIMVPLAGLLLFLQGLAKFCRDLSTAITGRGYEKAEVSKMAMEGR